MPMENSRPPHRPSRRWIVGAVAVAGMSAGAAPGSAAANATKAKLAPADIGYQNHPSGSQRCDRCVNWRPPTACDVVAGAISPAGWCGLFKLKS